MRLSRFWSPTLREVPSDAEIVGHQLLLKAGVGAKLGMGLYTLLPLGMRALLRLEQLIRKEMDPISNEILMPSVQPLSLWEESGRESAYGDELLRFEDRHGRRFCYGPTHEEVVSDLVKPFLKGHTQLPVCLYQIQTKFRDERRPRFGLMRAREFIMKDAYSFDLTFEAAEATYQRMKEAYCRIFDALKLDYRVVNADTGQIGGKRSEEFHLLADSGEDLLVLNDEGTYCANLEAAIFPPTPPKPLPPEYEGFQPQRVSLRTTDTQAQQTELDAHAKTQGLPPLKLLKTLWFEGKKEGALVGLVLLSEDTLNETKATKHPSLASPLRLASKEALESAGLIEGFSGPANLPKGTTLLIDRKALTEPIFALGINEKDTLLFGQRWENIPEHEPFDLRNLKEGEPSPDGRGTIRLKRGIEVGHIFLLGTRYSEAMNVSVQSESGAPLFPVMGCYGIGVSRLLQAVIEQRHDARGILWPRAIAPFDLIIAPLSSKNEAILETCESLYQACLKFGLNVALDDRPLRVGEKLNDLELMGFPFVLTLGERALAEGCFELQDRSLPPKTTQKLPIAEALESIRELLK